MPQLPMARRSSCGIWPRRGAGLRARVMSSSTALATSMDASLRAYRPGKDAQRFRDAGEPMGNPVRWLAADQSTVHSRA